MRPGGLVQAGQPARRSSGPVQSHHRGSRRSARDLVAQQACAVGTARSGPHSALRAMVGGSNERERRVRTDGAVSVVTGASSGIGEATARLLASQGSKVILAARRADRLRALAAQLPGALAVPTDVTDLAQVRRLVELTLDRYGRVDVLVNNAGQGLHVPIADLDPGDLRAVFDLNVVAPLTLLQAVLPPMRAQGGGAVVNVSSATSLQVIPGLGGYAATKAALNLLSATARLELADAGIALSVVYPRLTATEFHEHLRAGNIVRRAIPVTPDSPELVARTIALAIETGASGVLVEDPPRQL